MSEVMTCMPFEQLMNWVLEEKKTKGTVFGQHRAYAAETDRKLNIFERNLETPIGPAAGPHTQLTQNIVASYYAGARFFELKTVQKMDGAELAACINRPCILADDEGYNCEWSTELYVPQAMGEYIKAWFILHVIAKEFDLGAQDGFQFNISVGYDLAGIKEPKVNTFIDSMMEAKDTEIFKECKQWLLDNVDKFEKVTKEDIEAIPSDICNSATISTLHGCPPNEIESIANHLFKEKHLNTFIKCNPTLLGYEFARKTMDDMGYDYMVFGDFHFKDDLQYEDAIPMFKRLQALADELNLAFGVKITNTFPVDVTRNELPSEEMYMSGKSLFPLSISLAAKLSREFEGKLRIAYSGGADYYNIDRIVGCGVWPVTVATTLLKPGGYQRFTQMAEKVMADGVKEWKGIDVAALEQLAEDAKKDGAELLEPTTDTVTYKDGTSEEVYGFDIPVPAIDEEFTVAAIGKKGKWYDHKVSVKNPVKEDGAEKKTVADLNLEDGDYTTEVTLEGGSGRATVDSPAAVTIKDGEATATIVWSSPNYDYMLVGGEKYEPVNNEGNSTFEIPVDGFDYPMEVVGDTVAMSEPHEIEYTLQFDSSTMEKAE